MTVGSDKVVEKYLNNIRILASDSVKRRADFRSNCADIMVELYKLALSRSTEEDWRNGYIQVPTVMECVCEGLGLHSDNAHRYFDALEDASWLKRYTVQERWGGRNTARLEKGSVFKLGTVVTLALNFPDRKKVLKKHKTNIAQNRHTIHQELHRAKREGRTGHNVARNYVQNSETKELPVSSISLIYGRSEVSDETNLSDNTLPSFMVDVSRNKKETLSTFLAHIIDTGSYCIEQIEKFITNFCFVDKKQALNWAEKHFGFEVAEIYGDWLNSINASFTAALSTVMSLRRMRRRGSISGWDFIGGLET